MIRSSILTGGMRRGRGQAVAEAAGSFSDGYDLFGLEGNESFSPSSPTLKDDTSVSGDMASYLNAYAYWRDNQENAHADTKLTNVMGNTDAYSTARKGQVVHDTVTRVFRLTGDLRDLDYLCAGFDALQANLDAGGGQIEWDSGCTVGGLIASCCDADDPWSPYRKLNQTYDDQGTDLNRLNQIKLWSMVAEFTWALHLNQSKTSPGSVDYGTRLTYWKERLLEFVKAWSETSSACWATENYKGVDGNFGIDTIPNVSYYRSRQAWGVYPFVLRDEQHAALDTARIHRYVGLLGLHASLGIANPADALTCSDDVVSAYRTYGLHDCSNADHGDSLVFPANNPLRGNNADPHRMTYAGYVGGSWLTMWLTGAWRSVLPQGDMLKIGSAISWAHDGTTGLTYGNIVRGVAQCSLDAGSGNAQSAENNSVRGFAVLPIVFDPGGAKMSDIADNLITLSGGLSTPDRAAVFSALFVREALSAAGDIS